MKIAILDDYQHSVPTLSCFPLLADHEVTVYTDTPSRAILIERLQDKDALVLIRERTVIDEALLAQLPHLKLISQTGKVSQHLDLAACTRHGVAVAEGIGSPVAPAELTWALIMAASRHIGPYQQHLLQGQWQQNGSLGLGRTLKGLTLGIWGYGKIGRRLIRYAQAFEMDILIWGSEASRQQAQQDGLAVATSKAEFFASADIISLHVRLVAATRGIVTLADLQAMKPDALFVNTSRAELVEPDALLTALQSGRPGFAALDVFIQEPTDQSQEPLLQLPNVLATPHLGYVERTSYELYFRIAFENVLAYASSKAQNLANPEVISGA